MEIFNLQLKITNKIHNHLILYLKRSQFYNIKYKCNLEFCIITENSIVSFHCYWLHRADLRNANVCTFNDFCVKALTAAQGNQGEMSIMWKLTSERAMPRWIIREFVRTVIRCILNANARSSLTDRGTCHVIRCGRRAGEIRARLLSQRRFFLHRTWSTFDRSAVAVIAVAFEF